MALAIHRRCHPSVDGGQPLAPVTLVELTRNFGKEAAMLAGLIKPLAAAVR